MRIRKRTVKGNDYFYLEHSFRDIGKIVKKEIYLGRDIPKNIENQKKALLSEINEKKHALLEQVRDSFQREWKKIPESAKDKAKEEIAIAFTYNTNAIEGSTITLEETREIIHDKMSPNRSLRDVKETESHSKIFLAMLDSQEKITTQSLLRWHKEIFGETKPDIAGCFREYVVKVGSHTAPDWQDVPNLMSELTRFINQNMEKMNPIELAARSHFRFEKIHPFGDGNGRIGRLLMNQIIWHSEYPLIILEYKKRKSYYKAFLADEDRFLRYFIRRYLSVHKKHTK